MMTTYEPTLPNPPFEGARLKSTRLKSTRLKNALLKNALRQFFRLLDGASPGLATRLAELLFVMPLGKSRGPKSHSPAKHTEQPKSESRGAGERFTFVSGGRRLQAYVWGPVPALPPEREPRTVLLIHGWGGHGRQFDALVERLVDAEFRVVALDLPAHGGSEGRTTNAFEMRRAVLDLICGENVCGENVCGELTAHVGPLHAVIAHSFGAMVTALALDEGLHTKICAFVAPMTSFNYAVRAFSVTLGLSPRLRDRMVARLEAQFGISSAGMEVAETAGSRTVPLLVVHDSDDVRVPFDLGRALVEAWPGAKLHATSGLGHQRVLADPAVVDELVRFVSATER